MKRVLKIAASGGDNLLMMGPPGAGKSILEQRLPSIIPEMLLEKALEVSMIRNVADILDGGKLPVRHPFHDPHHSASLPALGNGSARVQPRKISLAHNGILSLDELPEFSWHTLEAQRQPMKMAVRGSRAPTAMFII